MGGTAPGGRPSLNCKALLICLPTAKFGDVRRTSDGNLLAKKAFCDTPVAEMNCADRQRRWNLPDEAAEFGQRQVPDLNLNRLTRLATDSNKTWLLGRSAWKRKKLI